MRVKVEGQRNQREIFFFIMGVFDLRTDLPHVSVHYVCGVSSKGI